MITQWVLDTGLWEVWVEYDEFDPAYFGTLYVIGEISTELNHTARFNKLPANGHTLILEVPLPAPGKGTRMKEILYSEPIESIDKYSSVCIYAGNELIADFSDIEIMI
ncbi:MAG: hypothetical protein ACXWV0_01190 [Flavisolibacter sp.]